MKAPPLLSLVAGKGSSGEEIGVTICATEIFRKGSTEDIAVRRCLLPQALDGFSSLVGCIKGTKGKRRLVVSCVVSRFLDIRLTCNSVQDVHASSSVSRRVAWVEFVLILLLPPRLSRVDLDTTDLVLTSPSRRRRIIVDDFASCSSLSLSPTACSIA
jgi:hypothetical protein